MKKNVMKYFLFLAMSLVIVSCEDFLNKEPLSSISPEDYYKTEDQLQAIVNKLYADVLPSHDNYSYGRFGVDANTDNQAAIVANNIYAAGQWKVGMDNGNWSWNNIRNINYSLNLILSNYNAGKIQGIDKNIRQYVGELYFMRAYSYFEMLQKWGDLPIIKEAFPDDLSILKAASIRSPRTEVVYFILEDLDNAIAYMSDDFDTRRNRLSPDVAKLVKSRVSLFEASWLNYFKGTPFVPNGEGWPGKDKEYNRNYEFPHGSLENEVSYFYRVAVENSEIVAEKYKNQLSQNTGVVPQSESDVNDYFYMFGSVDMSRFPDVLMWREYNEGLGIVNNVEIAVHYGNNGIGLTRSMIESFVMKDGKPWYAHHSGFVYDDSELTKIRANADPRLFLFLKEPGQKNMFKNMDSDKANGVEVEPVPAILYTDQGHCYSTGYALRKGGTFDKALTGNGLGYVGSITFRATEALLNYMEAQYMLTKDVFSGKILEYWKAVRQAAGFVGEAVDPLITINSTNMEKETLNRGGGLDWGSYSAGKPLDDKILYCIRRERRCELMAEGLRWMDLIRWRSLDQMVETPYHVEGFRLWNTPMQQWYDQKDLLADGSSSATVSSSNLSDYLRPYEKNMSSGNFFRDGYVWRMAHYLQPLPIKQFQLTATDNISVELSGLYQNPYWPLKVDMPAEK